MMFVDITYYQERSCPSIYVSRGMLVKMCLLRWMNTITLTEYFSITISILVYFSFKLVLLINIQFSTIVLLESAVVVSISLLAFHILQNYSESYLYLIIHKILKCSQVKYVMGAGWIWCVITESVRSSVLFVLFDNFTSNSSCILKLSF